MGRILAFCACLLELLGRDVLLELGRLLQIATPAVVAGILGSLLQLSEFFGLDLHVHGSVPVMKG